MGFPLSITLDTCPPIALVHAGAVAGVKIAKQLPENLMNIMNVKTKPDGTLEGLKEDGEGEPWHAKWRGPEHLFYGHAAERGLVETEEFSTGLDSGCVFGGSITGALVTIDPESGSWEYE